MANERQGVKPSARIKAILAELDRVAAEYAEANRSTCPAAWVFLTASGRRTILALAPRAGNGRER